MTMTAKIIGVIQIKGGAGRSTLSTNLAGELSKIGRTVLIDCDMPQGTSASWFAVRKGADKVDNLDVDTVTNHRELIEKVERYQDADFIVLDGPPRIAELTRAILMLANLCLIPVGASAAELWATNDLLLLVKEAKKLRKIKTRVVWTRYRPNTRLAQELTVLAEKELGLKALETALGMRVAFMEALGSGLTAAEVTDASAKEEVRSMVAEVCKIIG